MAYSKEDLIEKRVQVDPDTVGGPTYFVNGEPTCLSRTTSEGREGMFCVFPAGRDTDHPETGRCHLHGGRAGRPPLTGRYAEVTKGRLRQVYEEYFTDPQMLDLTAELALQRTLLAEAWRHYQEDGDYKNFKASSDILNNVVESVRKIENIRNNKVLTVAMAKLIMSNAIRIAQKYIPSDRMDLFISEWRQEVDVRLIKNE